MNVNDTREFENCLVFIIPADPSQHDEKRWNEISTAIVSITLFARHNCTQSTKYHDPCQLDKAHKRKTAEKICNVAVGWHQRDYSTDYLASGVHIFLCGVNQTVIKSVIFFSIFCHAMLHFCLSSSVSVKIIPRDLRS